MHAATFEAFWLIAFPLLALVCIGETRRRRAFGRVSLLSIAGFSIFWQEFYADWGAYLLWNPDLHGLPWGPTLWTTPHKPALNLIAYPVFMCLAFLGMLAMLRAARRRWPRTRLLTLSLLTAGPVLVVCNLVTEYVSVATFGLWTYTETYGPALHTSVGVMPLLFPNIPLGIFGAVTTWLIAATDDRGHPWFERWVHRDTSRSTLARESLRALSWALTFNVCYWLFLCTPLIVSRLLFGPPSVLVP